MAVVGLALIFDNTLANGESWKGHEHVGDPIPAMVRRVKAWLSSGKDVRIFTARSSKSYPTIRRWCFKHLGKTLKITNTKDKYMTALYDDRAVQVVPNTGELVK
jgi:hypothetical protein